MWATRPGGGPSVLVPTRPLHVPCTNFGSIFCTLSTIEYYLPVRKHNPYLFYQLAQDIVGLDGLPKTGGMVVELFQPLYKAQGALRPFTEDGSLLPPSSKRAATALLKSISDLAVEKTDKGFAIVNRPINAQQIASVKAAIRNFETVLANDCPGLDVFVVDKKGIYDTSALLENADEAIKYTLSDLEQKTLSEDVYRDFREAGRCLALELSTAAGFHTARSVEAVVRRYWSSATGKEISRAPRLANCIDQLRKCNEDPKILDILDHFRDLHRNTLMHPDTFLEINEALRLFDIAKSAISAVATRIAVLGAPKK